MRKEKRRREKNIPEAVTVHLASGIPSSLK
jgi:hypothetical protein